MNILIQLDIIINSCPCQLVRPARKTAGNPGKYEKKEKIIHIHVAPENIFMVLFAQFQLLAARKRGAQASL
jgi:hypothetical protein